MRIWDILPNLFCQQHLLGEHRELHGLWNILTVHFGRGGYSHHPETKRWVDKLWALYNRHQALVTEIDKREYNHKSPLDEKLACGEKTQKYFLDTIAKQKMILSKKTVCTCFLDKREK